MGRAASALAAGQPRDADVCGSAVIGRSGGEPELADCALTCPRAGGYKRGDGRLAQLARALARHARGHWFKSSIAQF